LSDTHCDENHRFLADVIDHFKDFPIEAIDAASFVVGNRPKIATTEIIGKICEHFQENPEKSWEFFNRASASLPHLFEFPLISILLNKADENPGEIFSVLNHCILDSRNDRESLLELYSKMVRKYPAKGIDSAKYHFQTDRIVLIRQHLLEAIASGFATAAYPGYDMLQRCCDHRPELIRMQEIDCAIANIEHASNYAFGFFHKILTKLPQFTNECTIALFDCLAREPVHRAFMRAEELETIIAISDAAQIRTGLEQAMREPPKKGSRRARALMAIMFRQKLRSHRHLLLEALRYAGTVVMQRKIVVNPGTPAEHEDSEKYSPIWDFLMFIIDNSGDDNNSTAAAERFLEGTYQLQYLYGNGNEHRLFLSKLAIGNAKPKELPHAVGFLAQYHEFKNAYDLLNDISSRFSIPYTITAIEQFMKREQDSQQELTRLRLELVQADASRKTRMAERERKLSLQLSCWKNPTFRNAFFDNNLADGLSEEEKSFLKNEKKNLIKNALDSVHAESVRVAITAVDRIRFDLYRLRVKEFTDCDVSVESIDQKILPAFLWFSAIQGMPNNIKYLKRLIEDRLTFRPHQWLRTEEPVVKWAEAVTKNHPLIKLDHWRAPFSQEIKYRAQDSKTEKARRLAIDLKQTRGLLEKAGAQEIAADSYAIYHDLYEELKLRGQKTEPEPSGTTPAYTAVDPILLEEIAMNLERIRMMEKSPESDYTGALNFSVESDPFEILFMGEYGFSSCLSLRGINAWSAVSNAIDFDKTVVWAKEPGGNVVGRRLLALTPEGLLTYNTYTNKNGLSLNHFFDAFIDSYASHCGVTRIHKGHPVALLSDRWYDDGSI